MVDVMVTEKPSAVKDGTTDDRPTRVLFVCTGNTCRSPMAEAVARHLITERYLALPDGIRELSSPEYEVSSAGLYANEGSPITPNAVKALESAGIEPLPPRDYRRHVAHGITAGDAECCDLLVGMTPEHSLELMMRFPHLSSRIRSMPCPVSDPFGGDEEVYRRCLTAIEIGIKELLFHEKSAHADSENENGKSKT